MIPTPTSSRPPKCWSATSTRSFARASPNWRYRVPIRVSAEHPGGQHEINALHVPINQPVQLTMISQDVFHSFSIPAFRVKREAIPGRYTSVWFEATLPGTYHLFCTQYCGTDHSHMIGEVVVLTPEDYKKWLERLAPFDPSPQRYAHNRTGEDNADAHHKRQIMGREVVVAITQGKLDFGPWEQIFYGEFDGRRRKRVLVKIIGQ